MQVVVLCLSMYCWGLGVFIGVYDVFPIFMCIGHDIMCFYTVLLAYSLHKAECAFALERTLGFAQWNIDLYDVECIY